MTREKGPDLAKHPCFNAKMKGQFGRVHLPVAPACNIKCNYCNRKYDCVNESRPGVTSTVLSPTQALTYMEKVLEAEPRISVAGIAGPGDPFANAEETMETLRLIRNRFPEIILCLASNGLGINPYIEELAELAVSHVTITINAVDAAVSENIYSWVRDGKVVHRGRSGAELLLARQLAAVKKLKEHNITVKINSIIIPGVNDAHIREVAERMKDLGADLLNCMALFPNPGTLFADIPQPDKETVAAIRNEAEQFLPQMRHCTRCRADAVGLLDHDRTEEFRGCLSACAKLPAPEAAARPYVAAASMEGILVNQHLGEAERFFIFGKDDNGGYRIVEERTAPATGNGIRRWMQLARLLGDCQAVLVGGIGEKPSEILEKSGIKAMTMGGFISEGLAAVYEGKPLGALKCRRSPCTKGSCSGAGGGCV
ncbi:MAG: nitrogenase cofactor biosynthesis protein NifB [Thermodesulfobacteriota bacterium]